MNKQAERIYWGLLAMAAGKAKSHDTVTMRWCGLVLAYYPASGTHNWWFGKRGPFSKRDVISAINVVLEDNAVARERRATA